MKTQEQEHHRCADHFHRFTIHPNGDVSSWLPSYLVRHDLEVLLDEALEAVEEARSAESCCATPYIQQRDQRLKELARIFRAHDWEGLRDDQLEIKKYSGGLSNKLYRCSSLVDPRQKILIRITGSSSAQQTEETSAALADREVELLVFQAVHRAGLGPRFYGKFKNGCVYDHVDGVQLTTEKVHESEYAALIAKRMAQWHTKVELPGIPKEAAWTKLVRKWLQLITEDDFSYLSEEQRAEWAALGIDVVKEMDEIDIMLKELRSPVTFCHNDVQPMNCIYTGVENSVSFIDFEYACYNYRGWDLGNHFCEYTGFDLDWSKFPSQEKQRFFLTQYLSNLLERVPTEREVQKALVESIKFTLVSHLYWGIWGLAQTKVSDIDYDFFHYSLRRLRMYQTTKPRIIAEQIPHN